MRVPSIVCGSALWLACLVAATVLICGCGENSAPQAELPGRDTAGDVDAAQADAAGDEGIDASDATLRDAVSTELSDAVDGWLEDADSWPVDSDAFQDAVPEVPFEFPDAAIAASGEILMLIYNVAGLPEDLSGSDPVKNMPQIAPLLNAYELVLVQEDFWYHADLEAGTTHPYKSDPMWEIPDWGNMGDGLNTFSYTPFEPLTRVTWEACNGYFDSGSDCMTTKGFTWTRHQLARGVFVDVYDLHMDAGGSTEDQAARAVQGVQLADFILKNSAGAAVIVGGDTNMRRSRSGDAQVLDDLMAATGLIDSCDYLACGDDRIDRVFFRSSGDIALSPLAWSVPTEFVDADGNQLSDHQPVSVRMQWSVGGSSGDAVP